MITCTRRIQFCAGHRVFKHESKCAHMHGHNYVVFVHAHRKVNTLDDIGRVIDFSVLKDRIGGWIDDHWDHGFLVAHDDKACIAALAEMGMNQKKFIMPTNPTAENIAFHLLRNVCPQMLTGTGVEVFKVVVWETENCFAEASL